ncbi:hypothetical protein A3Q56_03366 [Intoshia linei]|uniref:F-ATPase delta subunit n=1 Tax=Intoshia linei TaxID=1819745 RepID=A0A177B5C0_9BILA|nr:hypothetical protein A3Q56_03366 [Intoshia linei]
MFRLFSKIFLNSSRRTLSKEVASEIPTSVDILKLTFASPSQVLYNKSQIEQIDVPTFSGNMGILAKHVPTLAALKSGVIRVVESKGKTNSYFVTGGSLTINSDSSVQILAEEIAELKDIDKEAIDTLYSELESENQEWSDKDKALMQIKKECLNSIKNSV